MKRSGHNSTSAVIPILVVVFVSISLFVSACDFIPITEPEDLDPRIANMLDQPVDIYVVANDETASRSFLVTLSPTENYVWEDPQGRWGCVDTDLVAVLDGRDVDYRDVDEEYLCQDDVWYVEPMLPGEGPEV